MYHLVNLERRILSDNYIYFTASVKLEASVPKWVDSILDTIGVNSLIGSKVSNINKKHD